MCDVSAAVLSVGARRVLPGHLLRRSQVLSSLPIGLSRFQQRVAVTGAARFVSPSVSRLRVVTPTSGWLCCLPSLAALMCGLSWRRETVSDLQPVKFLFTHGEQG